MIRNLACAGILSLGFFAFACGGPENEQSGNSHEALSSCTAPVNALADFLAATRTSGYWCPSCSYVSVTVTNGDNVAVVNDYAGIDTVDQRYEPGFCLPGRSCIQGYWMRTGISGSWYAPGPISVGLGGNVSFYNSSSQEVTITADSCTPGANGSLTITGNGSDGQRYTTALTETWYN
jgi:hypothetical protein